MHYNKGPIEVFLIFHENLLRVQLDGDQVDSSGSGFQNQAVSQPQNPHLVLVAVRNPCVSLLLEIVLLVVELEQHRPIVLPTKLLRIQTKQFLSLLENIKKGKLQWPTTQFTKNKNIPIQN